MNNAPKIYNKPMRLSLRKSQISRTNSLRLNQVTQRKLKLFKAVLRSNYCNQWQLPITLKPNLKAGLRPKSKL